MSHIGLGGGKRGAGGEGRGEGYHSLYDHDIFHFCCFETYGALSFCDIYVGQWSDTVEIQVSLDRIPMHFRQIH